MNWYTCNNVNATKIIASSSNTPLAALFLIVSVCVTISDPTTRFSVFVNVPSMKMFEILKDSKLEIAMLTTEATFTGPMYVNSIDTMKNNAINAIITYNSQISVVNMRGLPQLHVVNWASLTFRSQFHGIITQRTLHITT